MPRYPVTLPNHTIDHDGPVEIVGGALLLRERGQLAAAFGQGEWREVVADGKAPEREPIPTSNNATRVLFEGTDLANLIALARAYATTPQLAALKAVTDAKAALP